MDVPLEPSKCVDAYRLVARPMEPADVPALHALSVAVRWPHRQDDWEMLVRLGHGVVAEDEVGRIAGSAMWWPMGDELVSVGMVITTPRLQEQGAGRWMMAQIEAAIAGRDRVLSATRAAFRLYVSLGYRPGRTVFQHQGIVTGNPVAVPGARPLQPDDFDAVRQLDAGAFTAERHTVLAELLAVSKGTVIERDEQVTGFALCRPFGRGHVVGPVVAESEADAVALVAPHVAAHAGRFLRLDTRETEGPLRDLLTAAGMPLYDTATSMALGAERHPAGPARIFALASQALG